MWRDLVGLLGGPVKKSTQLRRWLRRNWVAVTVGVLAGFVFNWGVSAISLSALHRTTADQRAQSLLACYGKSLRALATEAERFRSASFTDGAQLRAVARPMIPAIVGLNAAYVKLANERLTLSVELTRAWPRTARRATVVERLAKVDDHQWVRVRPAMNSALVYIIASWRHDLDERLLREIRGQQGTEWRDLHNLVQEQAAALEEGFGFACEPAREKAAATSQVEGLGTTRRNTSL